MLALLATNFPALRGGSCTANSGSMHATTQPMINARFTFIVSCRAARPQKSEMHFIPVKATDNLKNKSRKLVLNVF